MPENKRIGFGAGDKVALRCSATMTHRGDHLGMPATGKSVRLTGISITRIVKGKIIRRMGQLGPARDARAVRRLQPSEKQVEKECIDNGLWESFLSPEVRPLCRVILVIQSSMSS
jgi:SnoaL-like polyketide cyclase